MSITLEERQPRTDIEITSVDFGETETVLTAEGHMGEYGRVAITQIDLVEFIPHKAGAI